MATTHTFISSVTVGSTSVATLEFTSIPSTYTDLKVVISARNDGNPGGNLLMGFNGLNTSFSNIFLQSAGSGSLSSNVVNQLIADIPGTGETSNTFCNVEVYIPNYANSVIKSFAGDSVSENNATTAYALFTSGLWSNTAAISSIQITNRSGGRLFVQHSTAYLYGISNA
jgi:hypothetical protein